jgi:hypothetical protein
MELGHNSVAGTFLGQWGAFATLGVQVLVTCDNLCPNCIYLDIIQLN